MICDNCGLPTLKNKKCTCFLSGVEKAAINLTPTTLLLLDNSKDEADLQKTVFSNREQLNFKNRGSVIMVPGGVCPYVLRTYTEGEIVKWVESTINWFYINNERNRLAVSGVLAFAKTSLSVVDAHNLKMHMNKITPIVLRYT